MKPDVFIKIKNIAVIAATAFILFGFGVMSLILPAGNNSVAERRILTKPPKPTAETIFTGKYFTQAERFRLDRFPARNAFRILSAQVRFGVFRILDSGGIYIEDGFASKLDYKLDEKQASYGAAKFKSIIGDCLAGSNVYLSVVPDKNYYLTESGKYPRLDYGRLVTLVREDVPDAVYIDLFGMLSKDDYYRTDIHWDQRRLLPIAQKLADAMEQGADLRPDAGFTEHEYYPFYGSNYRYSALPLPTDTLYYLTSPAIEAAIMTGTGFEGESPVYAVDKLGGLDAYDVFAAGPQAVLTISSPNAKTDRELIIFHDSFGGSLAPLLLEGYAKITLVDLRYIPAALLCEYIDFHGQDALFLYSVTLLNAAMILK